MDNDILELRKALDTSSTNGNNVLDPVLLSKVISEQSARKAQIRNVIPRQPFQGKVYTWDTEVTPGDAITALDGATNLALIDGSYIQNQAAMSYFYHQGYITNPAREAAAELIDLVAMRVAGATKAVLRKENSAIFNGDPLNAQNAGLLANLVAAPTYNIIGDGATLSSGMLTAMEVALFGEGFEIDAWVVSKGVYSILKEAAFNKVTFFGLSDGGSFGFPVAGGSTLMFNGKPVIMDIYAGPINAVAAETLTAVGGSTVKFTFAHPPVNPEGAAGKTDQAGTALPAPVIKVSGATQSGNYSIQGNVITFNAAPAAGPTAGYSYQAETVYALSLNKADLCVAEQLPLHVRNDVYAPVQMDATPFRVQQYAVLAVRNPKAHAVATNVVLPATSAAFSS